MASKCQKFLKYSDDEKNEILAKYLNGIPSLQLEKQYGYHQVQLENGNIALIILN